jgi:hypothetical protein
MAYRHVSSSFETMASYIYALFVLKCVTYPRKVSDILLPFALVTENDIGKYADNNSLTYGSFQLHVKNPCPVPN